MRVRALLGAWLGTLVLAAPVTGAPGTGPQPLKVLHASVSQSGREVTWTVQISQPFSLRALHRDHRTLCLLLEHRRGGVSGQLCLAGPRRRGSHPRVTFSVIEHGTPGRAHFISASISRSSASEAAISFLPASIGLTYGNFRWQVRSTLAAPPCASLARGGECTLLMPRRPALARLHTPQVVGCVNRGAEFVGHGPATGRMIALTFDDGPWYDTDQFLDILERYRVPATFFEIGDQVSEYGQGGAVERRMLADGDMIGDHTWNHPDVARGGSFARSEISRTAAAIRGATHGFQPCLFRAPYGDVSPALFSVARSLGFKVIQWDIDPRDWARPGVAAIYDNVVHNAHPGAIIIQHDGGGNRSETIAALPEEIRTLKRRGYHFVTITQMFGMRLIYR
jgi:peptidoglycan/xylan/chitin deacetylase (PgdA/CDA1 family)